MAGEIWQGAVQLGKEVTPGTPVAATRKAYYDTESVLNNEPESRPHAFQTGRRDNILARTLGPAQPGGSVSLPLSSEECLELFLIGIKGGVTPVTPTGGTASKLWTFVPGTLDAATIEWHDGARPWRQSGVYATSINIAGNVREGNTLTAELMGMSITQNALTGALTDRTPTFYEGWETKLFVDALGATPGTTAMDGALISWDITINNNLARKYFAQNVNSALGMSSGQLEVEASLVFEASPATSLTEFNNWLAATGRLISIKFGDNRILEGALKSFVQVDIPGLWTAYSLGGTDEGTRTYELTYGYIYDSVLGSGVRLRAQNSRATAF